MPEFVMDMAVADGQYPTVSIRVLAGPNPAERAESNRDILALRPRPRMGDGGRGPNR